LIQPSPQFALPAETAVRKHPREIRLLLCATFLSMDTGETGAFAAMDYCRQIAEHGE